MLLRSYYERTVFKIKPKDVKLEAWGGQWVQSGLQVAPLGICTVALNVLCVGNRQVWLGCHQEEKLICYVWWFKRERIHLIPYAKFLSLLDSHSSWCLIVLFVILFRCIFISKFLHSKALTFHLSIAPSPTLEQTEREVDIVIWFNAHLQLFLFSFIFHLYS